MNYKKIIIIIITIKLIALAPHLLRTLSNEISNVIEVTDGEKLKSAGFISGDENGELFEDIEATNAQLITIITELYGKKEEARKYNGTSNYRDVDQDEWYSSFISYAEDRGWIDGTGYIMPNDKVTVEFLEEVVLTQLGYESKGLNKTDIESIGIEITVNDKIALTRGEVFTVLWQMINTHIKSDDIILGKYINENYEPS